MQLQFLNQVNQLNDMTKSNLKIDIVEHHFLMGVFYALLNFACWTIIPHLEFRHSFLSKLFKGNKSIACDIFAFSLIHFGSLRNLAFNQAINNSIKVDYYGFDLLFEAIASVLIVVGFIIICLSFYRLGLKGMYFGDHFGFLFKEKITAFPYNYLDNPQYVGTTLFFSGSAIFYHSPAGLLLTLLTYMLYSILNVIEEKKLKEFYPDSSSSTNDNNKVKSN